MNRCVNVAAPLHCLHISTTVTVTSPLRRRYVTGHLLGVDEHSDRRARPARSRAFAAQVGTRPRVVGAQARAQGGAKRYNSVISPSYHRITVISPLHHHYIIVTSPLHRRYIVVTAQVLLEPAVALKVADTKAAAEVLALGAFFEALGSEPERVTYGYRHVLLASEQGALAKLLICDDLFRVQARCRRASYNGGRS